MARRVAWLVVVERTGDCIDAGRTREQAREYARELTDAMEPCVVHSLAFDWPPQPKRRPRARGGRK